MFPAQLLLHWDVFGTGPQDTNLSSQGKEFLAMLVNIAPEFVFVFLLPPHGQGQAASAS